MSGNILAKVKEFLIKLVKDQVFRTQLQTSSIDQVRKILQEAGYTFSKEEFETAAIALLDLKERDEFHELTEDELVGAVGGIAQVYPGDRIIQPLYGVIYWPPKPKPWPRPRPIDPQPLYGVIIEPVDRIDPIIQPMYGVIAPTE